MTRPDLAAIRKRAEPMPCCQCGAKAIERVTTAPWGTRIFCSGTCRISIQGGSTSEARMLWNAAMCGPAILAHIDALAAVVKCCVPILQDYATKNPHHYYEGRQQDPNGVHGLLARLKELGLGDE